MRSIAKLGFDPFKVWKRVNFDLTLTEIKLFLRKQEDDVTQYSHSCFLSVDGKFKIVLYVLSPIRKMGQKHAFLTCTEQDAIWAL